MELVIQKSSIHTTKDFIMKALIPLNLGYIESVDIVPVGSTSARIVIHYSKWYATPNAVAAQRRFAANKSIDIIYNRQQHKFWRATAAK